MTYTVICGRCIQPLIRDTNDHVLFCNICKDWGKGDTFIDSCPLCKAWIDYKINDDNICPECHGSFIGPIPHCDLMMHRCNLIDNIRKQANQTKPIKVCAEEPNNVVIIHGHKTVIHTHKVQDNGMRSSNLCSECMDIIRDRFKGMPLCGRCYNKKGGRDHEKRIRNMNLVRYGLVKSQTQDNCLCGVKLIGKYASTHRCSKCTDAVDGVSIQFKNKSLRDGSISFRRCHTCGKNYTCDKCKLYFDLLSKYMTRPDVYIQLGTIYNVEYDMNFISIATEKCGLYSIGD